MLGIFVTIGAFWVVKQIIEWIYLLYMIDIRVFSLRLEFPFRKIIIYEEFLEGLTEREAKLCKKFARKWNKSIKFKIFCYDFLCEMQDYRNEDIKFGRDLMIEMAALWPF